MLIAKTFFLMFKCRASVKNLLIFVVRNVYSRHCVLNLERNDFLGILSTASSRFKSGLTGHLYRTKRLTLPNRTNFCKTFCKPLKNFYFCSSIKRGSRILSDSSLTGAKSWNMKLLGATSSSSFTSLQCVEQLSTGVTSPYCHS